MSRAAHSDKRGTGGVSPENRLKSSRRSFSRRGVERGTRINTSDVMRAAIGPSAVLRSVIPEQSVSMLGALQIEFKVDQLVVRVERNRQR